MRRTCLSVCLLAFAGLASAQTSEPFTGHWVGTQNFLGTPRIMSFDLVQHGEKLTGKASAPVEGSVTGNTFHVTGKEDDGTLYDVSGALQNGTITGTLVATDPANMAHPLSLPFTATLAKPVTHAAPVRHEFVPTVFYRSFSALNKPVLTIAPGDTIHTTTVDAGGTDAHGVRRSAGGNPETGPFYVTGAMPGDTLVVHIRKLTLNRDWASSDDSLDESAMNSTLAVKMKDNGKEIRWHLDLAKGLASPEKPGDHMKSFAIPVHPMLGCIATAGPISQSPPPTQDSGFFGGNMDYNEIAEGATVYLPVNNPGALLYFGDGHALQGDGELNGNALETSMDVELTIDVIPGKRIGGPRIETPTAIISMGLYGSLDDSFKEATSRMATWLEQDYKLTPSEIAQFMGVAAEYHVSEVADRNNGVVLKIAKDHLRQLSAPR